MASSGGSMSAAWSDGYVTDTLYTDNVYREQSPVWINYVAAAMGCVPRPLDRPFTYLELGCGLGHSITVFAAALPHARFYGVDFNPAHIDHAQRRAAELGLTNLTFIEASFQDLAADPAGQNVARVLGPAQTDGACDFVALHGIYSWIREDSRAAVQRIMFDRLKSGGLVYNSYNCLPGWTVEAPLQRLVSTFAAAGAGNSTVRARDAFAQIKAMADQKLGYFGHVPQVARNLAQYDLKPGNYLAHEFLNGDWNAFYSPDVAAEMSLAKLDFVGSATLVENHQDMILNDAALSLIKQQPDLTIRQLMQDFLINQKFRRDVYVRGHARLGSKEIAANLARQSLVAVKPPAKLETQIKAPRGHITFAIEGFDALKSVLETGAATAGDFAGRFFKAGVKGTDLARVLNVLTSTDHLSPAMRPHQPKTTNGESRWRMTSDTNTRLLARAVANRSKAILVSPVLVNPVSLAASDALILEEILAGGAAMPDLAVRVEKTMAARGMRLADSDKTPVAPDSSKAGTGGKSNSAKTPVTRRVEAFLGETLATLARLDVITAV